MNLTSTLARPLLGLAVLASLTAACSHKRQGADFAAASPHYSAGAGAGAGASAGTTATAPAAEAAGAGLGTRAPSPAPRNDRVAEYERHEAGDATVSGGAPEPRRSAGLGTAYGESRHSEVRTVAFSRASAQPDAVLQLRYNDPEGIQGLTAWRTGQAGAPPAYASYGPLRVSLIDERGAVLPAVDVGGQTYAIGQIGARYQIAIANDTGARYEVVASVDGLDVIDGQDASFDKRGYVVDPYTSFVIEGWRTSDESVAAFRFSPLEDGYAAQMGKPRNVGVIGVAFFRERGADYHELHRRDTADPFPQNRYAPPPPRRW